MLSSLMQRFGERRAAEFEAEGSAEAGFTLIELMVVLLILAILLAIAIPTFLGVTGSANDRAAQSNLNTALTNAKSIYEQNNQTYPTGTATVTTGTVTTGDLLIAVQIQSNEPSLPIATNPGTAAIGTGNVGALASTDGNGAVVYSLAKNTKECWWIADNPSAVTANGPWTGTGAVGQETSSTPGIPLAQGVYYGVFKGGACGTAGIIAALSNVKTPGFPGAA